MLTQRPKKKKKKKKNHKKKKKKILESLHNPSIQYYIELESNSRKQAIQIDNKSLFHALDGLRLSNSQQRISIQNLNQNQIKMT
jgi:hypothetical protein